jgi:hypothetical protein
MARGWESKSVESQMETAEERRAHRHAESALTPDEMRLRVERESLTLSIKRVQQDLLAATHPRRREQLQAALAHLQQKLADLT